jgi:hypothetical protein
MWPARVVIRVLRLVSAESSWYWPVLATGRAVVRTEAAV